MTLHVPPLKQKFLDKSDNITIQWREWLYNLYNCLKFNANPQFGDISADKICLTDLDDGGVVYTAPETEHFVEVLTRGYWSGLD